MERELKIISHLKNNWEQLSLKKGLVFINELHEISQYDYFILEKYKYYYFIKSPDGRCLSIFNIEEVNTFTMTIEEWRDFQLEKIL